MVRHLFNTVIGLTLTMTLFGSAYGQLLEFSGLRRLPPPVNSASEEGMPMLSPDGRYLFFTRTLFAANTGGKFSGSDIWYSERQGDHWRAPSNSLPTASMNTPAHNVVVGFSPDGRRRYFVDASPHTPLEGIYVTERINQYWTRPQRIAIPGIDTRNFVGVYVSPDMDVILLSIAAQDTRGEEDLYFSVQDESGQWSTPKNMGSTLNTAGFEIAPFLSADKKRLYFASNGHGGEGDADIFYSDRLFDSWETWSTPVNLGKGVNSEKFDAYFSIYGDSIAYFVSNRDGQFADIYTVDVRVRPTVLEEGQRYFTRADWERELGGSVSHEIVFPDTLTVLSASQQELLFYIANKLQLRRSVKFHLVVVQENDPRLTDGRLKSIADHLVESGIAEDRITVQQVDPAEKADRAVVAIRLFE